MENIINFEYSENFPNSGFVSLIFPIRKALGPLPKIAKKIPDLFLQAPTGRGVSEKGDFENTVSDKCCLDSMGNSTWSSLFL